MTQVIQEPQWEAMAATATARWFLEQLFAEALSPKRTIAIWDEKTGEERCFATPLEAAVYATAAGVSDVYAGAGLRQSGPPKVTGGPACVTAITFLRLELDMQNQGARPKSSRRRRLNEAGHFLGKCPLRPSIVVNSGHGLQAYWLFDKPWGLRSISNRTAGSEFLHRWESTTQCFAQLHGWRINPVWDLTGRIRIPGTKNTSPHTQGRIVWPAKAGTPVRYSRKALHRQFAQTTMLSLRAFIPPPALSHTTAVRLRLAHASFNGSTFSDLWNGQWRDGWDGGYPSEESAAFSLCRMLAYWLGPNPQLIANAFKASGLYRPKWDSPICGADETYGQGVIREAIARQKEFYRMPKSGGSR